MSTLFTIGCCLFLLWIVLGLVASIWQLIRELRDVYIHLDVVLLFIIFMMGPLGLIAVYFDANVNSLD
jgi:Ca2+/Na+ antiporter